MGCPPLQARRGVQMKAPSARAPRGKYAGSVLECVSKSAGTDFVKLPSVDRVFSYQLKV